MWLLDRPLVSLRVGRALVSAATAAAALALAVPAAAQQEALRAALKKALPEAPVSSVQRTPYGGLFEVTVGTDIYYVDEKASFVLAGPLIDLATKANITELRQRELLRLDFASLPLEHAIRITRGRVASPLTLRIATAGLPGLRRRAVSATKVAASARSASPNPSVSPGRAPPVSSAAKVAGKSESPTAECR